MWGKESQLSNWVGLWVGTQGIVLLVLTDLERPNPLWAAPFPRKGVLSSLSLDKWSTREQAFSIQQVFSHLSALGCECDVTII